MVKILLNGLLQMESVLMQRLPLRSSFLNLLVLELCRFLQSM